MSDGTGIEWTDATWNVVNGCSVFSPGCAHCYAMKLAGTRLKHHRSRAGLTIETKAGPVWNGTTYFDEAVLLDPLHWTRPRKIFPCAHGDLFHESVTLEVIDKVVVVMLLADWHVFQVLTKRSARMRAYFTDDDLLHRLSDVAGCMLDGEWIWHAGKRFRDRIEALITACIGETTDDDGNIVYVASPLPAAHIQLGVSVEDQTRADERIPDLLATPAAVRFLSCEPLLGPIDLTSIRAPREPDEPEDSLEIDWRFDCLEVGDYYWFDGQDGQYGDSGDGPYREHRIDWVIAGGENGPRPMHPDWAKALRDQCAAATLHGDPAPVPFLFKQWGRWAPVWEIPDTDIYYRPAPVRHPEAIRQCKVDTCVLQADGTRFDGRAMFGFGAYAQGKGAMMMMAIGKHRAGRLLDGVLHDGMPA